jgi:hypothetical protein
MRSCEIRCKGSICFREHLPRALVRLLDDPADLVVDLPGDLVGVVRLGAVNPATP